MHALFKIKVNKPANTLNQMKANKLINAHNLTKTITETLSKEHTYRKNICTGRIEKEMKKNCTEIEGKNTTNKWNQS